MKISRWRTVVAGLVLAGVMVPVPVGAAGIGSRPAHPDPSNPRTQSIFIYKLAHSETRRDQLRIDNGLGEQAEIEVYAVDGIVTTTGDMTCKQRVEPKTGAGAWVKLAQNQVTLAPGTSTLVDFNVAVPRTADVGEHNACLVVQRKTAPQQATGGVQLQTRQAVRMAIVIPGNIHRNVAIDRFAATHTDATKQAYTIALKNTGNVSADVRTTLTVKDMMGNVVYHNGGDYAAIANETRQLTYTSKLQPFWGGVYRAQATITYTKKAGEFGVSAKASDLTTKQSEEVELFFWPTLGAWLVLGGGVVVLGIVVWRVIVMAKRRTQHTVRRRARVHTTSE